MNNTTNGEIRPKKKLKQTSILEFMTNNKTNSSQQLVDEKGLHLKDEKNHTISDIRIIASISSSSTQMSTHSDIKSQINTSLGANAIETDISCNNPMVCSSQTSDQSIDGNNGSQLSSLSEIPETPPQIIDISDEELEDESVLLSHLNRIPVCLLPLPPLRADSYHYVLYRLPLVRNCVPKAYPNSYSDKWDSMHVKMPNSVNNQITAIRTEMSSRVSKWDLIEENLLSDIKSSKQLEECIKTYNPIMKSFNFDVLHIYFNQICEIEERIQFFDEILPKLIELALQLPSIVTQSLPLLRQKQNATLFLSQHQISCLLANAFFCTFPKRSQPNEEYKNYPIINFLSLFTNHEMDEYPKTKIEKLKCIVNYFRRILKETPKGVVSFERRSLLSEEFPDWENSNKPLKQLLVMKNGFIEKEGKGLLQVDFANKYVGGGVIGSGCVQEEIRFVICPELIISRLFTEKLLNNEVLIISGCEQFNTYRGYANTFSWEKDYIDNTVFDEWGRRCTTIVAIDALYFNYSNKDIQFETKFVNRELNKAYCGFLERTLSEASNKCAIASGNWGCGAFNGDIHLKAIIQLMAASQADRDLVFFTFNDPNLKLQLQRFYQFITRNGFTVKHLYRGLKFYQQNRRNTDLFRFICDSKDFILDICVNNLFVK